MTLARQLRDFERIVVPLPVDDYTTARVLTMDYVPGTKITAVSPVEWTEVDGRALPDELFRAYLQQILVDGVFHADPHPGQRAADARPPAGADRSRHGRPAVDRRAGAAVPADAGDRRRATATKRPRS